MEAKVVSRHSHAKSRGRLIVVEGIDGSGKSTQVHLLDKWLKSLGLRTFFTEWNSSEMVRGIISKGKRKDLLTPTTFSLLHATDFADRYERNIYPLIRAGYFVLADRYIYTAFARDVVRGCAESWVRKVYAFAVKPDVILYFRVPVEIAINRILEGRSKVKYYEAGMDLNLSNDPYESYRIFQGRIMEQYELMNRKDEFVVIDGTMDIEAQQAASRKMIMPLISGVAATTSGRSSNGNRNTK